MNRTAHRLLTSFSAVALVAGFVTANPSIVDAESPQAEILQPVSAEIDLSAEDDGNSDSPLEPTSEPLDKIVDADLRIEEELASQGSARVVIQLSTEVEPSATLSSWQEVVERRSAITFDQNAVERALSTADSTVLSRYQIVPAVAAEVTREGLSVLQSLPSVRSIEPDIPVPPVLDGTAGIIEADQMWASGYTGTDYAVVILDTGVQSSHPMFADGQGGSRVVAEACYSTNDGTGIESLCPGGASSSTAIGSGENCDNSISGCSHGTHVAGIAAGGEWDTGSVTISGVAPDADIISMQVFTKFTAASGACSPYPAPCVLSYTSDQLSALQRVQTLSVSHDIASVNMSLGGGRYYSACDNALIASTVEELAASGIATVIASGNNGFSDSVSSPACISSAVTVGSTTNDDKVSGFSNTAEDLIDLYAPGSSIISAVPTNSSDAYSGTSMAAPHVAGAFALIRNVFPNSTVDEIVAALRDTGEPVSTRQSGSNLGFSHPRLNIAQAVDVEPAPVLRVTSDGTGSGSVTSTPAGIDCGSTCTTVVPTPTSFTLTATADEGSSVTGWTGCDTTNGNTCTVNVVSSVNVKVTFTATAPTNDDFANAELIVSGANLSQSTVGATTETGEPIPSCDSGPANSVWFTWTAPASGSVTVDTIGSDFDTILAVYKDVDGTLSGLTEIDCDYGTAATGWTDSTITYSSTASTTYFVQVFGYQETVGSLQLSFAATAPTQQV
ncbi:MAG: S8 family serine peptidase, partial [Ilumatobacteraceae bacterium]